MAHREKQTPYIEKLREDYVSAYTRMLTKLNAGIVRLLKDDATKLSKAVEATKNERAPKAPSAPTAEPAAPKAPSATPKAEPAASPKAPSATPKAPAGEPKVKAPKLPKPKGGKPKMTDEPRGDVEHPGSRGGHWYRDDHGHVRYGTKPSARFHTVVPDDNDPEVQANFAFIVGRLQKSNADKYCQKMGVPPEAFQALKDVANTAFLQGRPVRDVYMDYMLASFNPIGTDAQGGPVYDKKDIESAKLYWFNVHSTFQKMVEDPAWKAHTRKMQQEEEALVENLVQKVGQQRAVIGVGASTLKHLGGDRDSAAVKILGMFHDLGLVHFPRSTAEAMAYVGDKEKARQLVGMARISTSRFNALLERASDLDPMQQVGLAIADMAATAVDARSSGTDLPTDFWSSGHHAETFTMLRDLLDGHNIHMGDPEWSKFSEHIVGLAKRSTDWLNDYNDDTGGDIYKALHQGHTDFKKLFSDPNEASNIREKMAAIERQRAAAVDAQDNGHNYHYGDVEQHFKPTPFQRRAGAFIAAAKRCILALGTGLGKTPIIIGSVSKLMAEGKIKRGIIPLPNSLLKQWPREIEKFRPGSKVLTIDSNLPHEDRVFLLNGVQSGDIQADFVLVGAGSLDISQASKEKAKDILRKAEAQLGKPVSKTLAASLLERAGIYENDPLVQAMKNLEGMVVLDEMHSAPQGLKDANDNHHLIARQYLKDREYVVGMSATPISAGVEDLFHEMNLVSPGSAGENLGRWMNKLVDWKTTINPETGEPHRVPVEKDYKSLKHAAKTIKPHVMLLANDDEKVQKELADTGRKMPSLKAVAHDISVTEPEFWDHYNKCIKPGYDDIEGLGKRVGDRTDMEVWEECKDRYKQNAPKVFKRVMANRAHQRRMKCAISPALVNKNYKGPEPKLDELKQIIDRHFSDPKERNSPIVVFCDLLDATSLAIERLKKHNIPGHLIGRYDETVDPASRDAMVSALQEGKIKVAFIGIKSGGAGLNLQEKAHRVVFLDHSYTPAQQAQAVGRVHRFGSTAPQVQVSHLRIGGTTDDRKIRAITGRADFVNALYYADKGEDYLNKKLQSDRAALAGVVTEHAPDTMNAEEAKNWTYRAAGLIDHDGVIPPEENPVYQELLDKDKYLDQVQMDDFKRFGDQKAIADNELNNLKLKRGKITPAQHKREANRIRKWAKNWLDCAGAVADHPLRALVGTGYNYQSSDAPWANQAGPAKAYKSPQGTPTNTPPSDQEVEAHRVSQAASQPVGADGARHYFEGKAHDYTSRMDGEKYEKLRKLINWVGQQPNGFTTNDVAAQMTQLGIPDAENKAKDFLDKIRLRGHLRSHVQPKSDSRAA